MTTELITGISGAIISILLVIVAFFAQNIMEQIKGLTIKMVEIEKMLEGTKIYMTLVIKKQAELDEKMEEFQKVRNEFFREYGESLASLKRKL